MGLFCTLLSLVYKVSYSTKKKKKTPPASPPSSQILAPNYNSVQQPPQTLAPNFPNIENPYEIPRESQTLEEIP